MTHTAHRITGSRIKLVETLLQRITRDIAAHVPLKDAAQVNLARALKYLWRARSEFETLLFRDHSDNAHLSIYFGEHLSDDDAIEQLVLIDGQLNRLEAITTRCGAPAADTAIRDARRSLGEAARHLAALDGDGTQ